ncbi:MAG: carboxypeptidase M32 [Anaerolineae bacterium]|nr:carboxypeptidase M32 [Anaerolineae bacterium]
MGQQFDLLKARLNEISDVNHATAVLGWEQETYMPSGAAKSRSEQLGTLSKISHEMFVAQATLKLLKAAAAEQDTMKNAKKAAIVNIAQQDYDRAHKLPSEFVAEMARVNSQATHAWIDARRQSKFELFAPWLKKNFDLARRAADYFGYQDHIYDALLDQYEPGMKSAEVTNIFADLRDQTVPLVKAIVAHKDRVSDDCLHGQFDKQVQEDLAKKVATQLGYDFNRGRMDYTAHPFCTHFSIDDVRITTRTDETMFNTMFFSVMHEVGHALYEQGVSHDYERTPTGTGCSLGLHESQSRMWENLVCRSRESWVHFYPQLCEALPVFKQTPFDTFYKAINKVEPSLIRVEADEVTYNLHIMVRFEMEMAMLEGKLKIKDVPEAWNAKYQDYLGLTPENDAVGCLQDVHWSGGLIGYFPTYTLGNLISVQMFERIKKDIPDLTEQFKRGEFSQLLAWLRKHLHQHGRRYAPTDLIKRATGKALTAKPYIAYLKSKFGDIYGLGG